MILHMYDFFDCAIAFAPPRTEPDGAGVHSDKVQSEADVRQWLANLGPIGYTRAMSSDAHDTL